MFDPTWKSRDYRNFAQVMEKTNNRNLATAVVRKNKRNRPPGAEVTRPNQRRKRGGMRSRSARRAG
jgi:hypothetical protein